VAPVAGASAATLGARRHTAFIDNYQRTINQKQSSVRSTSTSFESADLDTGYRYYQFDEKELGYTDSSFGCLVTAPTTYFGPCLTASTNDLNTQNPNSSNTLASKAARI